MCNCRLENRLCGGTWKKESQFMESGTRTADVLVIGGGVTGLSSAMQLGARVKRVFQCHEQRGTSLTGKS